MQTSITAQTGPQNEKLISLSNSSLKKTIPYIYLEYLKKVDL